jgi:ribosomal protein S18 acetylase RimI-like enzyme
VLAFAGPARATPSVEVGPARASDLAACERILRALPAWFGIEESIAAYVRRLPELEVLVARTGGRVVGFIAVEHHGPRAAEIHVMAVEPERHRGGLGRLLVEHTARDLRATGTIFLQVKTLSASREDAAYEATRRFYEALGFVPLEEHPNLWGPANPCLQMIRRL